MPDLNFKRGLSTENQPPIVDGQIIYHTDTSRFYFDVNNARIEVNANKAKVMDIPQITQSIKTIAINLPIDTEATYFGGSNATTLDCPVNFFIANIKKSNTHIALIDGYDLQTGDHYINRCLNTNTSNPQWTGWQLQPNFNNTYTKDEVNNIANSKQNKLTGLVDQVVGFNENGEAVAIDNPKPQAKDVLISDDLAIDYSLSTGASVEEALDVINQIDGWHEVNNLSFSPDSIIFCQDKFFAADVRNTIYSSEDGITWNKITTVNSDNLLNKLSFTNNKFFLTGDYDSNEIAYSNDGITWQKVATLSAEGIWTPVVYGNEKYVSLFEDCSILAYSYDGTVWQEKTLETKDVYCDGITFGNNIFVRNGDWLTYSYDCENWFDASVIGGSNSAIGQILFNNNKFIALSETGRCLHSYDGINWQTYTLDADLPQSSWSNIVYGDGKYLAITTSSNIAIYSYDGIKWYPTDTSINFRESCAYGNNKFIVVGALAPKMIYSTLSNPAQVPLKQELKALDDKIDNIYSDVYDITPKKVTWKYPWSAIAYGNNTAVLTVGGTNKNGYIAYSLDEGNTWSSAIATGAAIPLTDIIYADGKFVAVGAKGTTSSTGKTPVVYSNDGITWTTTSNLSSLGSDWSAITYGNGKYIVFDTTGTIAAESTDLINWTGIILPEISEPTPPKAVYGNGIFIMASGNYILYSTDNGENWTKKPLGFIASDIAYGNGMFVAVSESGSISYSKNASRWSRINFGTDHPFISIAYGIKGFVALIKNKNFGYSSKEGMLWDKFNLINSAQYNVLGAFSNIYFTTSDTSETGYEIKITRSNKLVFQEDLKKISSFQDFAVSNEWSEGKIDLLNNHLESGIYPLRNFSSSGATTGTNNTALATSSKSSLAVSRAGDLTTQFFTAPFSADKVYYLLRAFNGTDWSSVHRILTSQDTGHTTPAIATGSYTGGGTSTVTVKLGFTPRFILIHSLGSTQSSYKTAFWLYSSSSKQSNLCRLDSPSSSVSGVITTSNTGFTIKGSSTPYMNVSGVVHVYLALRG